MPFGGAYNQEMIVPYGGPALTTAAWGTSMTFSLSPIWGDGEGSQ